MKTKELHLYSIMRLDMDHVDEVCEDIRQQYEAGVTTYPLFRMTLVPEGDPVVDKAEIMCRQYRVFKEKLAALGVPSGILAQATIGHGWVLSENNPYQNYTNLVDGEETYTVCPMDKGFLEYIYKAMQTLTASGPDCIMVDDDFRLMYREGGGCACPLHMKRFHELTGTSLTRQELLTAIRSNTPQGKQYADAYIQTQRESLLEAARVMRAGIDSVDPAMPGSFCCVGNNVEYADEIAQILAGKGNPVVVRINNGNYTAAGPRFFSNLFYKAASQIAKLQGKVDVILAETDTCPQNRYSTGAMSVHTHFTGTLLEGARGAKHWITRLRTYEPESGRAYRKVLAKYEGFYEELARIVPTLTWRGCRIPVTDTPNIQVGESWGGKSGKISAWSRCVLERFGLPMYFSSKIGGVSCLEDEDADFLSDEQILQILSGPVFLASDVATRLIRRGFGQYLGVDVRPWKGAHPSTERLSVNGGLTNVQMQVQELVPLNTSVVEDSVVYHTVDDVNYERLFPGTTIYRNSLGGQVFVFSGTPEAVYNLIEAFSFLNESRKKQLIRMLAQTGQLPVYYPHDEEVYLRAADMADGGLFCALFNLGFDPIEQVDLVCESPVARIECLAPDGSRQPVNFSVTGDTYTLDVAANPLAPVILFLY